MKNDNLEFVENIENESIELPDWKQLPHIMEIKLKMKEDVIRRLKEENRELRECNEILISCNKQQVKLLNKLIK